MTKFFIKQNLIILLFFIGLIFGTNAQAQAPITLSRHEYRMLQEVQNLLAKKDWANFDDRISHIILLNKSDIPKSQVLFLLATRYKAQSLVERKNPKQAFNILEALYNKQKKLEKPLPNKYLQPLRWQLMYLALTMEKQKYALNILLEWFKFEPRPTAPAWYLLASLHTEFNQWQEARMPIENAIKLNAKNLVYLKLAVSIYYNLNLYAKAVESHKKYMNLSDAYDAKNWNLLMQLQLADNNLSDAVASLNIIWRNKFSVDKHLLDYLLGNLLQNNQALEAANLLRKWLAKNPNAKVKDWKTLIYAELEAKRFQQVVQDLDFMITKFPNLKAKELQNLWEQKANINFKQGEWLAAAKDWQNSIKYNKDVAQVQKIKLMSVRALVEAGKLDKAKQKLQELLKSDIEIISKQARYWDSYITNLTSLD